MLREARLKFTRELSGTLTIRSVGPDGIRINDQLWSHSVALTPVEIYPDCFDKRGDVRIDDLTVDNFAMLMSFEPELVLLGTGDKSVFPPRELVFAFARMGIGLEAMVTKAAARTFNVLAGEGRRVAALLIFDQPTSKG